MKLPDQLSGLLAAAVVTAQVFYNGNICPSGVDTAR